MRISKKIIERMIVTGPQEESKAAFEYCRKHGFIVIRSGPKQISINSYDPYTFELVAEREISDT